MSGFDNENGRKVAEAIDRRIINVAQQVFDKSARNKTVYGIVTEVSGGIFTIKIHNTIYPKVYALRSAGNIKVGDKVTCLVPNGNYSDMIILGVADGSLNQDSVIDNYVSSDGKTWYCQWASGKKECCLVVTGFDSETGYLTVDLPFSFNDTNFVAVITPEFNESSNSFWWGFVQSKTINSLDIRVGYKSITTDDGGVSSDVVCSIYCCGY